MKITSEKRKLSRLQSWYIPGDSVRNHNHFQWSWAWSYNCLTLFLGMLWSWKLHPSTIIILSQLGFLIKSPLCEKLLWATMFDSWVSGFIGFGFYLFESQSNSQVSPYLFLLIPELSYFSQEKKTWWFSSNVLTYLKCFNTFITFKVLFEKTFKNYPRLYFNDLSKLWFHFCPGWCGSVA